MHLNYPASHLRLPMVVIQVLREEVDLYLWLAKMQVIPFYHGVRLVINPSQHKYKCMCLISYYAWAPLLELL